jgi:hypothetical protein
MKRNPNREAALRVSCEAKDNSSPIRPSTIPTLPCARAHFDKPQANCRSWREDRTISARTTTCAGNGAERHGQPKVARRVNAGASFNSATRRMWNCQNSAPSGSKAWSNAWRRSSASSVRFRQHDGSAKRHLVKQATAVMEDGAAPSRIRMPDEEPAPASYRRGSHAVFHKIVVDPEFRTTQVPDQRGVFVGEVSQGLAHGTLRQMGLGGETVQKDMHRQARPSKDLLPSSSSLSSAPVANLSVYIKSLPVLYGGSI